jgi:transposase
MDTSSSGLLEVTMRKRRSFTPEFRHEAVRLALASDRPLSEIARELGIRPDQLRHWKQEITRAAETPAPASGETPEQELRRLRREVAVLRQERDFLKKAAAFFAKGSP